MIVLEFSSLFGSTLALLFVFSESFCSVMLLIDFLSDVSYLLSVFEVPNFRFKLNESWAACFFFVEDALSRTIQVLIKFRIESLSLLGSIFDTNAWFSASSLASMFD